MGALQSFVGLVIPKSFLEWCWSVLCDPDLTQSRAATSVTSSTALILGVVFTGQFNIQYIIHERLLFLFVWSKTELYPLNLISFSGQRENNRPPFRPSSPGTNPEGRTEHESTCFVGVHSSEGDIYRTREDAQISSFCFPPSPTTPYNFVLVHRFSFRFLP